MIRSFLDLEVYKESFQLQLEIKELLKNFPPSERFLLVDQMRRCVLSIPAQIAEGYAKRESVKEFAKYLNGCIGEGIETEIAQIITKFTSYNTPYPLFGNLEV